MAYPIVNSPTFPSVRDAFLPPKLDEMPVFNPGTHTYQCEDGSVRVMTEAQAINIGMTCKVIRPGGLGQASTPAPSSGTPSQGTPQPASPGPAPSPSFRDFQDFRDFDFQGLHLVDPRLYPAAPANASCAWEKDTAGNDIYVCRPQGAKPQIVYYAAGPVSYPAQVVFPGLFY